MQKHKFPQSVYVGEYDFSHPRMEKLHFALISSFFGGNLAKFHPAGHEAVENHSHIF